MNTIRSSEFTFTNTIFLTYALFVVRLTSLSLLGFVYHDHWSEVSLGPVRPAVLYAALYLLAGLTANLGLHWACLGRSSGAARGLLSALLPNGFLRRLPQGPAGRYIVLNVAVNLPFHLAGWLALTFYCWECTETLDARFQRLSVCFPVSAGFWMLALVLTPPAWRLSIRGSLMTSSSSAAVSSGATEAQRVRPEGKDAADKDEHQTAWSEKENSITTKL